MTTQVTDRSWNEGVKRQFPWIEINSLTSRIKVSKVSDELLEVVPSEEYGTNASGYYTHDRVRFHDDTGKVLGEVKPRMRYSDANDMSSNQEGETIGDAWYNSQLPTAVVYLTRKTLYSGGCLSHDPDTSDLEIFKVADFDIRWWMFQRDKASDSAVMAAGLGPDETHDGIKLVELRRVLEIIYKNFSLEEIRGLDEVPTARENPWCYISNALYHFLAATADK